MWNALFSVRGDMDRRTFALWSVVMLVTVMIFVLVALALGAGALLAAGRAGRLESLLLAGIIAIPTIAVLLWSTCALYAKRFRHMGVRPVLGIVVVVAGAVLLNRFVGRSAPDLWNYGMLALLLVWPGRKPAAPSASVEEEAGVPAEVAAA